jgi:hypothetical protein
MNADIYLNLMLLGKSSRNTLILFIKKLYMNLVLYLFCFIMLYDFTKNVLYTELSSYVVSSSNVVLLF